MARRGQQKKAVEGEVPPRERIVQAAAALFAARGVAGTPLREIAREAGTNVNLISYYFPSKTDLFDEVIDAPARELNAERERLLGALELEHAPDAVPVEDIFRAFLGPVFAMHSAEPERWRIWILILSQQTGTDIWKAAMARNLSPILQRFVVALQRSLPSADRADIRLSLELALTSMALILDSYYGPVWREPPDAAAPMNDEELEGRLLKAISAAANALG